MIITISGPPGSGKTTVGRLLAERLDRDFVSTGMIFREMSREKGLELEDFGRLAGELHDIDKELDKRILSIAMKNDSLVLEGRLAAHMLHLNGIKAFKVFVDAHVHTRAGRISGRESKPVEQVVRETEERERCERERYNCIYGIDLSSLAVYDLVVNSDDITAEQVTEEILRAWEARADA